MLLSTIIRDASHDAPNTSIRDLPAWLASGRVRRLTTVQESLKSTQEARLCIHQVLVKETVASKTGFSEFYRRRQDSHFRYKPMLERESTS